MVPLEQPSKHQTLRYNLGPGPRSKSTQFSGSELP